MQAPADVVARRARRPRAQRPRTLRLATVASVVVHGGLLAAALAIPTSRMLDDDRVTFDIVEPAIAPPPAAEPPPPKPPLVRAAMVKKARPIETPAAAPAAPPPPEASAAEPSPPVASAPSPETTQDPRAVLVAAAPPGAGVAISGRGAGGPGPLGVGAPTESQRRSLADRYRDELLRTRIRNHFRYPAEALELELIGRVVIQLTVDRNGRLLAARLAGSCPHQLLCEDGLRTVRAAAPFPALPPDLGDTLRLEIPLKYDFR